jgi:hypothetical protein
MRAFRGSERCPLCACKHNLKDYKAQSPEFKIINYPTYNYHNKYRIINENRSSLDRKFPSIMTIIEK